MKVIFLLDDNNGYLEVDPTVLQLRQLSPGQSALGVTVTIPVNNEDGTPKIGENGEPETTLAFRPLVNYAVNLTVPPPAPAPAIVPPVAVESDTGDTASKVAIQ